MRDFVHNHIMLLSIQPLDILIQNTEESFRRILYSILKHLSDSNYSSLSLDFY
jgi:hypothetical protein